MSEDESQLRPDAFAAIVHAYREGIGPAAPLEPLIKQILMNGGVAEARARGRAWAITHRLHTILEQEIQQAKKLDNQRP